MLSLLSCIFPKWACCSFIRKLFSRRKWHQLIKIGLYSEGRIPRSNCLRSVSESCSTSLQPRPWPCRKSEDGVHGQALDCGRGSDLPSSQCGPHQCVLCPKKPSVRRGCRVSCAEAGPRALTGRFPRCRRCRQLPWQIPDARHWSPGQCCGRCSRRQHPPEVLHTE